MEDQEVRMEDQEEYQPIIDKLKKGMKFGLYDNGHSCYFDDGTQVVYTKLWTALRILYNLDIGHNKTLFELCPDTYRGVFENKFSYFRFSRLIESIVSGKMSIKPAHEKSNEITKSA